MVFCGLLSANAVVCAFCFALLYRDIPMPLVSSGVEHGNLRELALARMKDLGTQVKYLSVDIEGKLLDDFIQNSIKERNDWKAQ